jgi:hypothetical protein
LKSNSRVGDAFVLFLFLIVVPFCVIIEMGNLNPTITVEASDEVDVEESLQMTFVEYSPASTVTVVNDTSFENSFWRASYSDTSDRSTFWRYVNIPLRNVTEVIVSAFFAIEGENKEIGLYSDGWLYIEEIGHSGQNENLTHSGPPTETTQYGMNIKMKQIRVEFDGDFRESMALTGFWIKVILNDTLYPVSIDMQRTNGESLFSDAATQDTQIYGDIQPWIQLITQNEPFFASYYPTQTSDLILLPSGNYTFLFYWYPYRTNKTINIQEEKVHILWRIHSVKVEYRLTQEVPGYIVDLWESDSYSLSQSPVFVLPSGINYTIDVRGNYCGTSLTTALGANRNITVWISPNTIVLGPYAIMPTTLFLIVGLLSMVFVLGIARIGWNELRKKLVPFSLIVLGYVFPWVSYTQMKPLLGSEPFVSIQTHSAAIPSLSSTVTSTSDSLMLISYEPSGLIPYLAYFLLFMSFVALVLNEDENASKLENILFWSSISLILIMVFFQVSSYFMNSYYTIVEIGLGAYMIILGVVAELVQNARELMR